MRDLPNAPLSPCPNAYARLAAQRLDTVQEAFALRLLPAFVELLTSAQAEAVSLSDNLDATVTCNLNGQQFQIHATGARGGFRWRIENDDILILIGSPQRDWPVSVRYLSAGLWEYGLEALRTRVFEALAPYTRHCSTDCVRVTRADYCFDFYSPAFTDQFMPRIAENVVCHSSTKAQFAGKFDMWSRSSQGETLTIGSKSGFQVQLYNKTLEINEASGKTWLYDVWASGLDDEWPWADRPCDMWRLECRFSRTFLKERNVRRPHEFKAAICALVTEALYARRLTVANISDSHRHRWPLHPLWSEAIRQFNADAMLPIGRKVTGRRENLINTLEKAIAGTIRAASILESGQYNDSSVISLMHRARARITRDPRHLQKVAAAHSRYFNVDEAK